jgi:CRISPR/Cas system-associated exonuclease Cas4 (RecB family)
MNVPENVLALAPWSYSKAGDAISCPHLLNLKYLDKVRPAETAVNLPMEIGNAAHLAIELALDGMDVEEAFTKIAESDAYIEAVKEGVRDYREAVEEFVTGFRTYAKTFKLVTVKTEGKYAIMPDFTATTFFNNSCLIRGKIDLLGITYNGRCLVIDHKSGMVRPISDHQQQLDIYAVMACAEYPQITEVRGAIHHMGADKNPQGTRTAWSSEYSTEAVKTVLRKKLIAWLTQAAEDAVTREPRKNWKCKNCVYKPTCPLYT